MFVCVGGEYTEERLQIFTMTQGALYVELASLKCHVSMLNFKEARSTEDSVPYFQKTFFSFDRFGGHFLFLSLLNRPVILNTDQYTYRIYTTRSFFNLVFSFFFLN